MSTIKDALMDSPSTSYFEAFTALAIKHFADAKVDWAVMEAGLGGVKDATNVFRPQQVCKLLDHTVHGMYGPPDLPVLIAADFSCSHVQCTCLKLRCL